MNKKIVNVLVAAVLWTVVIINDTGIVVAESAAESAAAAAANSPISSSTTTTAKRTTILQQRQLSTSTASKKTESQSSLLPQFLDCEPCIRRPDYIIKAVVHGTKQDKYWQVVQAAMIQSGKDMGIQFHMDLYDIFDPIAMSNDIRSIVDNNNNDNDKISRVDALIVTRPSKQVHDAIQYAVNNGIPVFGFNSGYNVAEELGIIGFVAQNEYNAGITAANEFISRFSNNIEKGDNNNDDEENVVAVVEDNATTILENNNYNYTTSTIIRKAVFVNHQKGNTALEERFQGFKETLLQANHTTQVDELVVDVNDILAMDNTLRQIFEDCSYDIILSAGIAVTPFLLEEAANHDENDGCTTKPIIATFDEIESLQREILRGKLSFALVQQKYLQGVLSVIMASLYVTTGTALILPVDMSTYLSGPLVIDENNLPPDSQTICESEAFPICPNNKAPDGKRAICDCFDRSEIRIGGVLHGITSDKFWDPVFLSSEQAAKDMGITLELERISEPEYSDIVYVKMAARIKSLCEGGVDGIFVTIPDSQDVKDSIKICQLLNIPVIAVNSNPEVSKEMGVQHIGQDEYLAGYLAGRKLLEAGMTDGYCLNQEGNSGSTARCEGFIAAIGDAGEGFSGNIVVTPLDLDARVEIIMEEAVGRDDDWTGVAWLIGARHLEPSLGLQIDHQSLLLGMFDVGSYADIIFTALDEGKLLFTSDQQPFLQGNFPVYLLTYMAYTQQKLLDDVILTGPSLITSRPTQAQQTCETNMWEVCSLIPNENLNYIPAGWLDVGYFFTAATVVAGLVCLVWIYYCREKMVVRASQPPFLVLLVVGAIISSCAIIPMGIETSYRESKDPFTLASTGTNPSIDKIDAACMTVPWLYGIGFALMFSALFAKIWRVKLVYQAGLQMRRKNVSYKDVMFVLVAMFFIELVLLITWQVVSPLQWEREVVLYSGDGYPLESVGKCDSESGWYFMAAVVGFHIICLFYALILCWQARHIPPEFADSNLVSLSVIMVFQISILAIPIGAMVQDETDVFYFVRACALFLQSFTVLCLIFVPKMYKTFQGDDELPVSRIAGKSSMAGKSQGPCQSWNGEEYNSTLSHKDWHSNSQKDWNVNSEQSVSSTAPAGVGGGKGTEFAPLLLLKSSCCDAKIRCVCSSCGLYVDPAKAGRRSSDSIQMIEEEEEEEMELTSKNLDQNGNLPHNNNIAPKESESSYKEKKRKERVSDNTEDKQNPVS